MFSKFIKNLSSPFPYNYDEKSYFYIPPMIILILIMFHPFGLKSIEPTSKRFIVESGYGIVTFIILIFNSKFFPSIFPKYFHDKNWTVWKEIVTTLIVIFTISVGNTIYTYLWGFTYLNLVSALFFMFNTTLVAIFPITISIFIRKNHYLQQNLKSAEIFNDKIGGKSEDKGSVQTYNFSGKSENEHIELNPNDLLYIQSQRNYIQFFYQNNESIKNKLIRSPMKDVEKSIENFDFLQRCHRSYIVNINYIEKVEGDSLGLLLHLKNCDIKIPVSRSCVKDLKNTLQK